MSTSPSAAPSRPLARRLASAAADRVEARRPGCPRGGEVRGGAADEDPFGYAKGAEQRGKHEQRLGGPARRQLVRAFDRQGPGHRLRRGRHAARAGEFLPALGEHVAVVAAAHARGADRGTGLRNRQRVAGQVVHHVDRPEPPLGVRTEPGHEVGQRLVRAERANREDHRALRLRYGRRVQRAHQHPAGRPGRPEPVHIRRIGQVVNDDEPRPVFAGEPGKIACGGRLRVGRRPGACRAKARVAGFPRRVARPRGGGPRIAGQDEVAAGSVDPYQQAVVVRGQPVAGKQRG